MRQEFHRVDASPIVSELAPHHEGPYRGRCLHIRIDLGVKHMVMIKELDIDIVVAVKLEVGRPDRNIDREK